MSPEDIERVFGRDHLRITTGRHVEVFREGAGPGDRRWYTKRFLSTNDGDYREWTEREWRILARLVGHGICCVPEAATGCWPAPARARLWRDRARRWGCLHPAPERWSAQPGFSRGWRAWMRSSARAAGPGVCGRWSRWPGTNVCPNPAPPCRPEGGGLAPDTGLTRYRFDVDAKRFGH